MNSTLHIKDKNDETLKAITIPENVNRAFIETVIATAKQSSHNKEIIIQLNIDNYIVNVLELHKNAVTKTLLHPIYIIFLTTPMYVKRFIEYNKNNPLYTPDTATTEKFVNVNINEFNPEFEQNNVPLTTYLMKFM